MGDWQRAIGALAVLSTACTTILGFHRLRPETTIDASSDAKLEDASDAGVGPLEITPTVVGRGVGAPALVGAHDGFALAWVERTDDAQTVGNVRFTLLDAFGQPTGETETISPDEGTNVGPPTLAYTGSGYGVGWFARTDSVKQLDIYKWRNWLVALDFAGARIGNGVQQIAPAEVPAVAWDGTTFAFVWPDGTYGGTWDVSLDKYATDLSPAWTMKKQVTSGPASVFGVTTAALDGRIAIGWYDRDKPIDAGYQRHVRLSIRSDGGQSNGGIVEVTNVPTDDYAGVQVCAGSATFALSWLNLTPLSQSDAGQQRGAYVRVFDRDGVAVGVGPQTLSNLSAGFSTPRSFFDGTSFVLVWGESTEIRYARISELGLVKSAGSLLTGLAAPPGNVAAAWNGDRVALAWDQPEPNNGLRLFVQTVPSPP